MQVMGTIEDIRSRNTSVGTMYDIIVDGNEYGVGKYAPRGFNVGDAVAFTAEINGRYRRVARGTMRKASDAGAPAAGGYTASNAAAAPARTSVADPKEKYWADKALADDARQNVISKQAALNTAIAFIEAAIKAEALPLPAKAADKIGLLEATVIRYAGVFHEFSTGKALPGAEPSAKGRPASRRAPEPEQDDVGFDDDELPPL